MNPEQWLEQLYRHADEAEREEMCKMLEQLKLPNLRSRSFPSLSTMPIARLEWPTFVPPLDLNKLYGSCEYVYTFDESANSPTFTFRNNPIAAANEPEIKKKPEPLPEEHMVSAITGYRAWNVPLFVDELRSVARSDRWVPYKRFEAECDEDQCAGVSCGCGIYVFKEMDSVQAEYRQDNDRGWRYVRGECWLWGRILECEAGYRAQFAYPKSFINTGAISKRMAEVFGVELIEQGK